MEYSCPWIHRVQENIQTHMDMTVFSHVSAVSSTPRCTICIAWSWNPCSLSLWCRSAVGSSPLIHILIAVNHKQASRCSVFLFLSFYPEPNLDIDIADKTVWATKSRDMLSAAEWKAVSVLANIIFLTELCSLNINRIKIECFSELYNFISSIYCQHVWCFRVLLIPPRRAFVLSSYFSSQICIKKLLSLVST